MMYQNKYRSRVISAIIFLSGIATTGLSAQIRYTSMLPETDVAVPNNDGKFLNIAANNTGIETARSLLIYKLDNMPASSRINMMTLKMYVASTGNPAPNATQLVTALKGPKSMPVIPTSLTDPAMAWTDIRNNKAIGRDEVKHTSRSISLKLALSATQDAAYVSELLKGTPLILATRSPEKSQNNLFYSSQTAQSSGKTSMKPKLIVKYEIEVPLFNNSWSQLSNGAQHTGYLNWYTNGDIKTANARPFPNTTGDYFAGADPTGAILIYNNKPIALIQSRSAPGSPYGVRQFNTNGDAVWTTTVNGIAKCWPLIDNKGRLYYFTSNDLTVLDLNNNGAVITTRSVADLTHIQSNTIINNATIGYDETLYLPTDNGLTAISAYPQSKIRWQYRNANNEIAGPVTLSRDESKAYFISVNTSQHKSRLVVLDNMDGAVLDSSAAILGGYQGDAGNLYIPAPVVLENKKIFVLNGYDNSNTLFVFNQDPVSNKLVLAETIRSANPLNTGISQPVISDESNVFFVLDEKLAHYDPATGSINKLASSALNSASILVTDRSSGVFALDPYNGNKVYGFKYDGILQHSFSLNLSGSGSGNLKKNLVLSPNGILYTISDNKLIAIAPKNTSLDNITLSPTDWVTNKLYRADNMITVNAATILPTVNSIVYSGGGIKLMPGFHVKKGAQLSFRTGYQNTTIIIPPIN